MTEDLHDTRSIPDESWYWNEQSARVAAAVAAERRNHQSSVADRGWFMPAAAVTFLAAAAIAVVMVRVGNEERGSALLWRAAFAPSDILARSVIASATPPRMVLLVLGAPARPRPERAP
jgi:hypothetical protein